MPFTILDPITAQLAPVTTAGDPVVGVGTNFAEFKEGITEDLAGRGDISTRLGGWINREYSTLSAMLELNELNASVEIALVADQPLYLVPDVLAWITWFGNEDAVNYRDGGRGFEMIDLQTYRMLPDSSAFTVSSLLPSKYFRFGKMLVIWPTPDIATTAVLDFRVRPRILVNDYDCPILPPEFHSPLYDMSEARAMRKLGMRSEGDRAYNDALASLRPLLNTDAQEKDAMHMAMQPIRRKIQLYRGGR